MMFRNISNHRVAVLHRRTYHIVMTSSRRWVMRTGWSYTCTYRCIALLYHCCDAYTACSPPVDRNSNVAVLTTRYRLTPDTAVTNELVLLYCCGSVGCISPVLRQHAIAPPIVTAMKRDGQHDKASSCNSVISTALMLVSLTSRY